MKAINLEKFADVRNLDLAVFSTFCFEPEYFEYRLLRQSKLGYARRILVLMDRNQYVELLSKEIRPRNFNRRYLVVPVSPRKGGVFHPKLQMLVGSDSMHLACGSANLTSAGFSHNLEAASVFIDEAEEPEDPKLWVDAFQFYQEALGQASGRERNIALAWLEDLKIDKSAYFEEEVLESTERPTTRLLHSAAGASFLGELNRILGDRPPDSLTVLSPFFDTDFRVLDSVRRLWPGLPVTVITQERNGVVPVDAMGKAQRLHLQGLRVGGSRRLHAKLLVFQVGSETFVFSGSANFSTAALEGRNVEAGIWFQSSDEDLEAFWGDEALEIRDIDPADFESGQEQEPKEEPAAEVSPLCLNSAELSGDVLQLDFKVPPGVERLSARLRPPGGEPVRSGLLISSVGSGWEKRVDIDDVGPLTGRSLLCELEGKQDGVWLRSNPVWLVFPEKLTYDQGSSRVVKERKRRMQETGEGLASAIQRECDLFGWDAAIALLENLGIRYDDGSAKASRRYSASRRPHDPWRPDEGNSKAKKEDPKQKDFEDKLYAFVERHRKGVLGKHIRKPNPSGARNFVNVMATMADLIHGFYRKGQLRKRPFVIDTLCNLLGDAAGWERDPEARRVSYLSDLKCAQLDQDVVRQALEETCFFAHTHILLAMVQRVRDPEEPFVHLDLNRGKLLQLGRLYGMQPSEVELKEALAFYPSNEEDACLSILDLVSQNLLADIPFDLFCSH